MASEKFVKVGDILLPKNTNSFHCLDVEKKFKKRTRVKGGEKKEE